MKKMIVLWLVCFMAGCSSQEPPKTITELPPASTAGRVRMILRISPFFKSVAAYTTVRYVFPVPATPLAKTISLLHYLHILHDDIKKQQQIRDVIWALLDMIVQSVTLSERDVISTDPLSPSDPPAEIPNFPPPPPPDALE